MELSLLPQQAVTKEVMQAVKRYAWNRHSTITSSDVDQWKLDEEEYDQLEFEDGYLVISVEDVRIEDFEYECGYQTWYVTASIYVGWEEELGDPNVYSAWKDDDGEWVIEWDHC